MNIHEYQAKGVLREFGVPVPRGIPAFTADEAVKLQTSSVAPSGLSKRKFMRAAVARAVGSKS